MEKFEIAYPCHKYLLRAVTNDDEFQVFAANYANTLLQAGISYEDIKNSFIMFCANYGSMENSHNYRVDLSHLYDSSLEAETYVNTILSSKPVTANCVRYYKVTIEQRANICKICPLSESTYQNKHFDDEIAILKYFLNNPDDLNIFLQQCELSRFTAILDCNSEFLEEKPLLFPIFKTIITTMKKEYSTISSTKLIGKSTEDLLEYFIPDINTALSRIKNVSYKNIPNLELIHKYIWSIIAGAKDLTLDEVYDLYSVICNGKTPKRNQKKKSEVKPENYHGEQVNLTLEEILGIYEATVQKENAASGPLNDSTPESNDRITENEPDSGSFNTTSNAVYTEQDFINAEKTNTDDTVHKTISDTCEQPDNPAEDIADCSASDMQSDERDPFSQSAAKIIDGTFRIVPPLEQPEKEDVNVEWSGITLDTKNIVPVENLQKERDALEDIIPSFRVDRFQLYRCGKDLADNTMLLQTLSAAVIADKKLYVEAVFDDAGEPLLLLWDRKCHQYLYTYLNDDASINSLFPLLSAQRISKYCYSPYLLYALIGRHEGCIRNVYSILTNHRYIIKYTTTEKPPTRYKEVLEYYTKRISFGTSMIKLTGKEEDITNWVLLGMPMYQYVVQAQQKNEKNMIFFKDYAHMRLLDEALGYSYLTASIFPKCGTSFYLSGLQDFHFNNLNSIDKCTCDGYLIRYEIIDNLPEENTVLENVICNLVEKGRFRQYKLFMYTFCKQFVIFFIGAEDFEFLSTLLHLAISDELEEQNYIHASFQSFYKHIEKTV